MFLRTGTILDLTAIARDIPAYVLANELCISKGAISNYISSSRSIKKETLYDLAFKWAKSIKPILNYNKLIPKYYASIDDYLTELFIRAYNSEMSKQNLITGENWEYGFSCCAAQVLSPWSDILECDEFNSTEAKTLLSTFVGYHIDKLKPHNEFDISENDDEYWKTFLENVVESKERDKIPIDNEPGILQTIKYILWRIKTREGYYYDKVPPETIRKETQNIWPIPKIEPDMSSNVLIQYLPSRPALKRPSVIDILMICRGMQISVEFKPMNPFSEYKDVYSCSCLNLKAERIKFLVHLN